VRRALAGDIVISTQVLAEFAATLLHRMFPAAPPEDVAAVLDALGPIGVVVLDGDLVRRAVDARGAYGRLRAGHGPTRYHPFGAGNDTNR
jgi:hypothetical protein